MPINTEHGSSGGKRNNQDAYMNGEQMEKTDFFNLSFDGTLKEWCRKCLAGQDGARMAQSGAKVSQSGAKMGQE
ncbi:MAG: hypothetical protein ABSG53_28665 [Thermoguttaceae bacterium]